MIVDKARPYISCDKCGQIDWDDKLEGWHVYYISSMGNSKTLLAFLPKLNRINNAGLFALEMINSFHFCSKKCKDAYVSALVSGIQEAFRYQVNDMITGVKTPEPDAVCE